MPQRQYQPLEKLLYGRAALPGFVVEWLAQGNSFVDVFSDGVCNLRFCSYKYNLVHVAEAAVIEIWGTQRKNLVVD